MKADEEPPCTLQEIKNARYEGNYYLASKLKQEYDKWLEERRKATREELRRNRGQLAYYKQRIEDETK